MITEPIAARTEQYVPRLGRISGLVHLVYAALTGMDLGIEVRSALEGLFYVSNWFLVTGHGLATGLEHLWSLSVEERSISFGAS